MKIEIQKINWNEDKNELLFLLKQLPRWRLEKANSFYFDIDKYLCAKSFLLLKKILFQEYNLSTIPEFFYGINGKPYFNEYQNIYFNISHCKSGIACIVDNRPVGIDIEEIYFDNDVAENVLSKKEFEIVQNADYPEQEFIKYWTMKESYLKLTGEGIVDDLKNILKNCKNNIEFRTYMDKNFSFIATAAFKKATEKN